MLRGRFFYFGYGLAIHSSLVPSPAGLIANSRKPCINWEDPHDVRECHSASILG